MNRSLPKILRDLLNGESGVVVDAIGNALKVRSASWIADAFQERLAIMTETTPETMQIRYKAWESVLKKSSF